MAFKPLIAKVFIVFRVGIDKGGHEGVCCDDLEGSDIAVFGEHHLNIALPLVPPATGAMNLAAVVEFAATQRRDFERSQVARLQGREIFGVLLKIKARGVLDTIDIGAKLNAVEVEFEDAVFRDHALHTPDNEHLLELAGQGFAAG